jgi:hypothetical protein
MGPASRQRIQFVPNDPDKAAHALDAARLSYTKRDVLVVRILDEPGLLGGRGARHGPGGHQHRLGPREDTRAHRSRSNDPVGGTQVAGEMGRRLLNGTSPPQPWVLASPLVARGCAFTRSTID